MQGLPRKFWRKIKLVVGDSIDAKDATAENLQIIISNLADYKI